MFGEHDDEMMMMMMVIMMVVVMLMMMMIMRMMMMVRPNRQLMEGERCLGRKEKHCKAAKKPD